MRRIACGYNNGEALFALVDDDMFDKLAGIGWSTNYERGKPNSVKNSKGIKMHHLVIGKPPIGHMVDHINRNPLDNRRENLRFVTPLESTRNTSTYNGNVHRTKGGFRVNMLFRTEEHAREAAKLLLNYRIGLYGENHTD